MIVCFLYQTLLNILNSNMCRKLLIGTRRSICVGLLLGLRQKCFVERKPEPGQISGKQASSKEIGPIGNQNGIKSGV